MTAVLIRGDALHVPLKPKSVNLIVMSPPYWAQRSYQDGGEHFAGQIGDESTPLEFIDALVAVTAQLLDALTDDGSLFVNLGDKYTGSGSYNNSGVAAGSTLQGAKQQDRGGAHRRAAARQVPREYNKATIGGARPKSLMGLPWRYAIRCVDELGLILRAELVWSKPNGLPESVDDRVRRSHETFFHFVKQGRYFSALDEIRPSSGDGEEPFTEHLPGCAVLGSPADPLPAVLVVGRHEPDASVETIDLPNHERPNRRVEDEHVSSPEHEREIRAGGSPIPLLIGRDAAGDEDGSELLDDGAVAVVDGDSQMRRRTVSTVREADGSLAVDDPGEPCEVCTCGHATYRKPLGRVPGSVWEVATEPLLTPAAFCSSDGVSWHASGPGVHWRSPGAIEQRRVMWLRARAAFEAGDPFFVMMLDHFAAFPQEWPRQIILGWSPPGICTACGEGRRPVVDAPTLGVDLNGDSTPQGRAGANGLALNGDEYRQHRVDHPRVVVGYSCACDEPTAPTRPAVVLDPFGGTGTTAMVAQALGRCGVHIDLSADYLRLADWRIHESGHASKTIARTNADRQGVLL